MVGVGDKQTMDGAYPVLMSFNFALCAYVPVCLNDISICLRLHLFIAILSVSVLAVAPSLRNLEN